MTPQKSCCYRFRCMIVALVFLSVVLLISVGTVIIRREQRRTEAINRTTIAIRGLLTVETAPRMNVCRGEESVEDCVLVHNAKILMTTMMRFSLPSTENSSAAVFNVTGDCKRLRIRRNQLSQIFEPETLRTLYQISGVPALWTNDSIDRPQTRSQFDARSIRNRWTSPINYFITTNTGLTPTMIANIRTAIANWQNNTCLTFNELTAITPTTNRSYIRFERDDEYGCSSPVGYDPTDPTSTILLAAGCGEVIGTVMHEIGHTLGYIHTHSRIDRNAFVNVMTSNIDDSFLGNFFIWSFGTIQFADTSLPYDYASLLHYNAFGFSRNGQPTIVTLDPRYERTIGQREVATFYDYKSINRLYCARSSCAQMFNGNACQNNGYLDPRTCSRCICPEGFSGTFCDQRDAMSNCGGTITNPTPFQSAEITIENPIPTNTNPQLQYCVYHIRSQVARRIRLRLDSINTARSFVCQYNSMLEVKYQSDLALNGPRWCGRTVPGNWSNITAETNLMVVIFRANNFLDITTGAAQFSFRATIFFDPEISVSTLPTITTTTTTTTMSTTAPSTTTATGSSCPPSSFRCRLPDQPTCGGCLNFQPCRTQGLQQCTITTSTVRLTDCNLVGNGFSQCRFQIVQVPIATTCQRTILFCCPNYQLISFQNQHFCVFNPQATNSPNDWSIILP